jgi:hypothetical protein
LYTQVDLDTIIIQSKLEQAVLFGASAKVKKKKKKKKTKKQFI